MPSNWPELSLALALALVAAYAITAFIARRIERWLRGIVPEAHGRTLVGSPLPVLRWLLFFAISIIVAVPALRLAGYRPFFARDSQAFTEWLLAVGVQIALIAAAAYVIVRIGSIATRQLVHEMSSGTGMDVVERTKRAQTIGNLLQNTLATVVIVIASLTALRQLGVDITPALTGAGIAGLAVGFGAQTLVRDVISGFFLILEDQVRVGDVAVVNGTAGLVESVNLRTIVLRDEEGTVHVFPNGEVKTLANKSKDFGYSVISVSVPWDEDPERVIEALTTAGASLLEDPAFRVHILAPLEIYGVEAFEVTQVVVKGRIKTVPLKQWLVGRELRKRAAKVFRERGIKMPGMPLPPAPPAPKPQ